MPLKNPVTPPGIDLGTVQLVAQRLNHYATPGYGCEIWTVNYRLKKRLLSAEVDFRRRAAGTHEMLEVRNEVIRGKMGVNSVERGTQYVEMVLTRFTHGITDGLSKLILTLDSGRKKKEVT
jgi:hypothetical protein